MKQFFWSLLSILLSSFPVISQITGLPSYQKELNIGEELKSTFQQQIQTDKETLPITTVVNDTFYVVGPNDIFSILISPTNVNPEITKVSPDGQLILPRYGFVKVSGKTLLEVKGDVEQVIKSFNPNASVSLSLFKPRLCLIRIYGNVKKPGVYYLPASYRVSDAVSIANQEYTTQDAPIKRLETSLLLSDLERKRESELVDKGLPSNFFYSSRNIIIYNQVYGLRNADLELCKSRRTFEFDPYVREGDEIFVPHLPIDYEYVTISGAVVQPGKYSFKKGDRLSDLLKFAKGFKESANFSNVLLINGEYARKVQLDSSYQVVDDFELEPYATVIVGEKPVKLNEKFGVAGIYGCVAKPGLYPIEMGKTRLLDLLSSAGGLNCSISYSKSFVLRSYQGRKFWDEPTLDMFSIFKQSNLTMEDTMRFKMDLLTKGHFVSCNLYELIEKKNLEHNILLSDGDLVVLQKGNGSIYVWGQVKNPGYVAFEEGKDVEWFINRAGGFLPTANKSRVRVIRGPQKVWLEPKKTALFDGDEIYVPGSPDNPPGTEYQYYSLIATGVATLISLTYLIINLTSRRN